MPESRDTPGSPGWAARIRELAEAEPSPRRVALFRVADAIRGVLHRMVQSSAPNEVIETAAADLEAVAERFAAYSSKSMYEGFAESWSTRDGEFADRINSMPKYVASRTLTELTWNATLIEGDVAEGVARLKEQPGRNILKWGTGELDRTLVEHGLVDEFHFWSFPVIVGAGKHLFEGAGFDTTHVKLADVNRFDSGIVVHVYVPK